MATAQSKKQSDPGRVIAMLALEETHGQPGAMLERVVRHAFDQLCWSRTTPELHRLLEELRALVAEEPEPDPSKPNLGLGHTADCQHFKDRFPWKCDCQVKAAEAAHV